MPRIRAFLPDSIFSGGRMVSGAILQVRDGLVESVGEARANPADPAGNSAASEAPAPTRLRRCAVLPGLVSAHSHAFQRAIRGRTEWRGPGQRDDFWSWREAMYSAAERLSPDDLAAISRFAFLEMARAGITAVGEFHYLHRDAQGQPYQDPNELERRVASAAREVGLRTVLLRVAYARAGFQIAANPRQQRFIEESPEQYLQHLEALVKAFQGDPLLTAGAAPHSVRACPAHWIEQIAAETRRRGMPLHLHVSEQPGEVAQCKAEHGVTPPLLLERLGALDERTTAVHAVHLEAADLAALGRAGATVCACPTTERNLGDGVVRADRLLAAGARLCLGTDSNVQIAPLEDARALEYHLRLVDGQRNVLDPGRGNAAGLAARLYSFASEGGMRSLGLPGGALRPGDPADFIVVDLDDLSIAGAQPENLLSAVVFSLERTAIRSVFVAGEAIVQDGHAAQEESALEQFRAAMQRLWGQA